MSQRKPLSIITVCYNEKNIEATCLSIVHQTWQDFEWIVVDGGSTDGTLDILERYRDRIDILISEKDDGIFDGMNKGIRAASGKYLNFMNGGDYFLDRFVLEKLFVENSFNADIIYGDSLFLMHERETWLREFPDILPPGFFKTDTLAHQATFIKKSLFDQYGLYNKNYRIVSDWEKFIEFIVVHNASYVHYARLVAIQNCNGVSSLPTEEHMDERADVMKRFFHEDAKERKDKNAQRKDAGRSELPAVRKFRTLYRVKLLGFIPLLKIRENERKGYLLVCLFNCIPVFKVKIR